MHADSLRILIEVELVVVLRGSEEHKAVMQSRCLGLTGTDIYIYIYRREASAQCDYLPYLSAQKPPPHGASSNQF